MATGFVRMKDGTSELVRMDDGVRLRVVRWGLPGGPAPVVLVHGFTGSVEAWGDLPARLASRLSSAAPEAPPRAVVAVDLPGHGESDAPDRPGRYAVDAVAGDLAAVLDHLGARRAIWAGYSMGGRVALATAALRPERTRALVLESASPGLATEQERHARRMQDEALAERILGVGLEPFVDAWMRLPLFETQRRLAPDVLARERERRLRGSAQGLANALRGLGTGAQPSFWERLTDLRHPVLLLTGAEDGKFTDLAARMAGKMPEAHGVQVPATGHAVHLEAPEVWLREVTAYVLGLS